MTGRHAAGRLEPLTPAAAGPLALPLSLLHRACFPEDPWDPSAISAILGIPGFFGRIAWRDDEPAGFAFAVDLGGECEILALGVVPGRRRAGLGSALLDSIGGEARGRGARSLVLEVAADNAAARALYAASGFVPVGRRRNYYRRAGPPVDALILRLMLAGSALSI